MSNFGKLSFIILALVFCVIFGFSPSKVKQSSVIKTENAVQVSLVVANKPVKWVVLIDPKSANQKQYLTQLPKTAENIKISVVSKDKADEFLKPQTKELGDSDRKALAQISKNKTSNGGFFLASATFSKPALTVASFFTDAFLRATSKVILTSQSKFVNVTVKSQEKSQVASILNSSDNSKVESDSQRYITVEYETPGPSLTEKNTTKGKTITLSSAKEAGLGEVIAYAVIPDEIPAGEQDRIQVRPEEGAGSVPFQAFDLNNNGKIDYVEWHADLKGANSQTFEIIYISKALLLDRNKNKIEDIYKKVQSQDDIFQTVKDGQYIRVTFERELASNNDITLFAKSDKGAKVEVYPVYDSKASDKPLTVFPEIKNPSSYKIFLSNLSHSTDTFDLEVEGDIEIDYIVDPPIEAMHYFGSVHETYNWGMIDGKKPYGDLALSGNTLYGMTSSDYGPGVHHYGSIFSISTSAENYRILRYFHNDVYYPGATPYGSLIIKDSTLYGMTSGGGDYTYDDGGVRKGYGIIFSMSVDGSNFTVLHDFGGVVSPGSIGDGKFPYGSLAFGSDGRLYGMTKEGGNSTGNYGVIFSMTASGGDYKVLHSFSGGASDGATPYGSLTAIGSTFYGMTSAGGASTGTGYGTIFSITTAGVYNKLYSFAGGTADGANPWGSLAVASDGKLYGTTRNGGSAGVGTIFSITTSGNYGKLYDFRGSDDGANPSYGSLAVYGSSLYGMTYNGGGSGGGTIFSISTTGNYEKLRSFPNIDRGRNPYGSLISAGGGVFYGMTSKGGTTLKSTGIGDDGILFPFVFRSPPPPGSTDLIAPVTTASAIKSDGSEYILGTWTDAKNLTLTLNCTDIGGSNCAITYYCLMRYDPFGGSGGSCTPTTLYTGSIPINEANPYQVYTFKYYSVDNTGNEEQMRGGSILIDAATSDISYSAQIPNNSGYSWEKYIQGTWVNSKIAIRILSRGDDIIYFCTYSGDTPCTAFMKMPDGVGASEDFFIDTEGVSYVRYYAEDSVGNRSDIETKEFKIDYTDPVIFVYIEDANGIPYISGDYSETPLTVELYCYDAGPDCAGFTFSLNGVYYSVTSDSYTFTVSAPGTTELYIGSALTEIKISAPASGSISYKDGYVNDYPTINFSMGSGGYYNDGVVDRIEQARASSNIDWSCNAFSSFSDLSGDLTSAYSGSYGFSGESGYCYKFRYFVSSSPTPMYYYDYRKDSNGNLTTVPKVMKVDRDPPTGGSLDYELSSSTSATISITSSLGFGVDPESVEFQRFAVPLTGGPPVTNAVCGSFDGVVPTVLKVSDGTLTYESPYIDHVFGGFCYEYKLSVSDYAGNTTTHVKVEYPYGPLKIIKVMPVTGSPPVTTLSAKTSDGSNYTFGDVTAKKVTVTMVCNSALSNCANTYYCVGTDNSCTPSTVYTSGGVEITLGGTSYIRYYSIDNEGRREATGSKTIRYGTVTTLSAKTSDGSNYTFDGSCAPPLTAYLRCESSSGCANTYYCVDADNSCTPSTVYTSDGIVFSGTSKSYDTLHSFNGSDGQTPVGSLISDGINLYGATLVGGEYGYGTIYSIKISDGTFTTLHDFGSTLPNGNYDGKTPSSNLIFANSKIIGATSTGGYNEYGTIFSMDYNGNNYKILTYGRNSWGVYNAASLMFSPISGRIYGATAGGKAFYIYSDGTGLKAFGELGSGNYPVLASDSVVDSDGNETIYGVIKNGGSFGAGKMFYYNPSSTYGSRRIVTVHDFGATSTDGKYPTGLFKIPGSNYYDGVTSGGGRYGYGIIFGSSGGENSTPSVKHDFNTPTVPYGSIAIQNSGYYGATSAGGDYNYGGVFSVYGGSINIMRSFNGVDSTVHFGDAPLILDRTLYATNNDGYGTVFSLSLPRAFNLRYYSVDNNSNHEATKSLSVIMDSSTPVTAVSARDSDGNVYNFGDIATKGVTVSASCSDAPTAVCPAGCARTYYCLDSSNTCTPDKVYVSGGINVTAAGTSYVRYSSIDSSGNKEETSSRTIRINNNFVFAGLKIATAKTSALNNWCLPGGTGTSYPGTQITILGGEGCDITPGGASDNGKCTALSTVNESGITNPPSIGPSSPLCPGSPITAWSAPSNLVPSTKYVLKLTTNTYCPGIYSSFAGNKACWVVSSTDKSCSETCNKYGLTPTSSSTTCYNNDFDDCSLIEGLKGSPCTNCSPVTSNSYNYFDSRGNCYYTDTAGWANNCSALAGLNRICACDADNTPDYFYFPFTTPSSF